MMQPCVNSRIRERRWTLRAVVVAMFCALMVAVTPRAAEGRDDGRQITEAGLRWLAGQQSRIGHWGANDGRYPTAMTSMAGMALLAEGSTTTQGKYSKNIRRAVDYVVSRSNPNGLIGDAKSDDRYTYGHGFAMLFLSQVLGEEEDESRRKELVDVLSRAVIFTGQAQTPAGGWGYVSAKDGNNFDEGSTTITQVQALRGCRNAGINVPKEIIDKAIGYIQKCTLPDGGVQYSSQGGGGRPAISAAALACLFNAGEYDNEYVPRVLKYCTTNLNNINNESFGHWHYAH
ncbi:MAG: prenyltransferase/squalene oxidase repeat-containing protein, partial [Pirellulales bacterium]